MGSSGIRFSMGGSRRLSIAKAFVSELRQREGPNLVAAGVYGSVARGEDREHSDIDLLVVVRRHRRSISHRMLEGTLVTVLQLTPDEARAEVHGSRAGLNDVLGGWRSLRPLHDPRGLLARLRRHAMHPSKSQFHGAAAMHLLETFEDLGKLRNAVVAGDREEAREMAVWYTGAAMGSLHDLDGRVLTTGRRGFIELRGHGTLDEAVRRLRYETLSLRETARVAERIWSDLVALARRRGIPTPG